MKFTLLLSLLPVLAASAPSPAAVRSDRGSNHVVLAMRDDVPAPLPLPPLDSPIPAPPPPPPPPPTEPAPPPPAAPPPPPSPPSDPSPSSAPSPPTYPSGISFTYSGNGCPGGSASTPSVSSDGDWAAAISFAMARFAVESGKAPTQNCQVHLTAVGGASPGWQVGLADLVLRGYVMLDQGVELDWFVQVYWTADAANTKTSQGQLTNPSALPVSGPISIDTSPSPAPDPDLDTDPDLDADPDTDADPAPSSSAADDDADVLWSPCVGADGYVGILNVNTRLVLRAASAAGTVVEGDGAATQPAAAPYGYFGGRTQANVSTAEDWVWKWRQC